MFKKSQKYNLNKVRHLSETSTANSTNSSKISDAQATSLPGTFYTGRQTRSNVSTPLSGGIIIKSRSVSMKSVSSNSSQRSKNSYAEIVKSKYKNHREVRKILPVERTKVKPLVETEGQDQLPELNIKREFSNLSITSNFLSNTIGRRKSKLRRKLSTNELIHATIENHRKRVIVVGDRKCGKTSLLKRTTKAYVDFEMYCPTYYDSFTKHIEVVDSRIADADGDMNNENTGQMSYICPRYLRNRYFEHR